MENSSGAGRRVDEPGSAPQRKRSANRKKRKKRSVGQIIGLIFKVLFTLCLIGILTVGIFTWIFKIGRAHV